ncbi:uncharacterized protein LOC133839553 [Drosophila sulfurigaster albostrigata]|uniref:uncharacterized protein LOC133839553 n=1 Tax=Drosophila sulfurigaster albostrigata TaxID=89887 RepID=UPI002D21E1A1|nr:uncharacterized protein LOC133839553 [Drosophila sulfurigaster albostrigata]
MFIAQYCAIEPVGHLSKLLKTHFDAKKVKLHRTKCTNLIKNVVSVHFNEDLGLDPGNEKFSLLIGESTDISITKLLGVAIIYYSAQCEKIQSTFLSLVSIESGDALNITKCLLDELSRLKIPVYTLLKDNVPSLILVKCVCHSVQLSVNAACKVV